MKCEKCRVNKRTIINKILEGIGNNGYVLLNGLGTTHYTGATMTDVIDPLVKYLERKGVEVK